MEYLLKIFTIFFLIFNNIQKIFTISSDKYNTFLNTTNSNTSLSSSENSDSYNLTIISKFKCENATIDCSNHGICSNDTLKCICEKGYQTFYKNYEDYLLNKPRCNYKSKNQLNALLFAVFLSFGSVHFYLGNNTVGIFQLIVFSSIFIFNAANIIILSIKHLKKLRREEVKYSFNVIVIMVIFGVVYAFWYLFDLIMVYMNIYRDSNNAKMFNFSVNEEL